MHRLFLLAAVLLLGYSFGTRAAQTQNNLLTPHAGDLVCLQSDKTVPFTDRSFFSASFTILYFSAGWCPDCRKFSPELVAAYDAQPPTHRDFEVLFISQDRSEAEMRKYMTIEKMRWPALAYDKVPTAQDLARYHPNKSIPWLAVIDRSGRVVLESESDKDASDVLKRLQNKLADSARRSGAPASSGRD